MGWGAMPNTWSITFVTAIANWLDVSSWLDPDVKDPNVRLPLCPQHRSVGSALRLQRNEFQTETQPIPSYKSLTKPARQDGRATPNDRDRVQSETDFVAALVCG